MLLDIVLRQAAAVAVGPVVAGIDVHYGLLTVVADFDPAQNAVRVQKGGHVRQPRGVILPAIDMYFDLERVWMEMADLPEEQMRFGKLAEMMSPRATVHADLASQIH